MSFIQEYHQSSLGQHTLSSFLDFTVPTLQTPLSEYCCGTFRFTQLLDPLVCFFNYTELQFATFLSSPRLATLDRFTATFIMNNFSCLTLNTNGMWLAPKRRALFTKLRKTKVDFLMLQETHSTTTEEKVWLTEWGSGGVFSHGLSNSRGVCTLFNKGTDFKITQTITDDDGRFLIIQLDKGSHTESLMAGIETLWL